MERKLRHCSVCGKEYRYCPRCNEDKNKPYWYFIFCSSDCNDIYEITSKFENGQITAMDAKVLLEKLDLSRLNHFGESYQSSIDKIMKAVPIVEETDSNIVEEEKEVLKKPKTRRGRNNVE